METYLLLARSVTHAQQMMRILERGGIYTKVQRAGGTLTQKGCGYSLRIQAKKWSFFSISPAVWIPRDIVTTPCWNSFTQRVSE